MYTVWNASDKREKATCKSQPSYAYNLMNSNVSLNWQLQHGILSAASESSAGCGGVGKEHLTKKFSPLKHSVCT